jgi:hypothetical protein
MIKPGDIAPDVILITIEGQGFSLTNAVYRRPATLLIFYGTWVDCPAGSMWYSYASTWMI